MCDSQILTMFKKFHLNTKTFKFSVFLRESGVFLQGRQNLLQITVFVKMYMFTVNKMLLSFINLVLKAKSVVNLRDAAENQTDFIRK